MYAVIVNDIVKNAWWAKSQEEAENDNPGAKCVQVTTQNSPWTAEEIYDGRI